jgi:DNA-binding response OmpR family regulator
MNSDWVSDQQVKIWILDDDQAMCLLLARQCEKLGWQIHSYHHPKPFLLDCQTTRPDLLVLDQLLPDKHGLDVLTMLRQDGKRFPVVILSALGAPNDRIAGLEAGADDYLSKPFQFRELQLRIERLLRPLRTDSGPFLPPFHYSGHFLLGSLRFEAGRQHRLRAPSGDWHRLSRGDGALLLAFCRHPGVVLSRDHLLQATGSLVAPGESRTIDVRLSRLRRLVRDLTGADLVLPVRGRGYKLVADVKLLPDGAPDHSQA